ncbi:MAG: hypothetical protein ACYTGP_04950 [Planctomycetota bacterium]|jgi:type II secretory pathway pseudopilin PulG
MTTRAIARPLARAGFTIVELLTVIAIIIILLGLLLPALSGVWSSGALAKSMNNMRQIALWLGEYSNDNSDFIVPSRFHYGPDAEGSAIYAGKVRSSPNPAMGVQSAGTWSDILHSVFEVGVYPDAGVPAGSGGLDNDYRHDSPDRLLYDLIGEDQVASPFRAAAPNSRNVPGVPATSLPKPYGDGAFEVGLPGFFAANDFFFAGWPGNSGGAYFTNGQIRVPSQSMYLVDSFAGEVILPKPAPFNTDPDDDTIEVDFRYGSSGEGVCLILLLDGHVQQESPWVDIDDLESKRRVRVRNLTSR